MLHWDKEVLNKVGQLVRENCPAPEPELIRLSNIVAKLPRTKEGAEIRRIVLDIDDLTAQTRWHLGQALLLMEAYPQALGPNADGDEVDKTLREIGMPSVAMHLIRGFIRNADQVIYDDLTERRHGGTVAGWIFHMMIDSAIYRVMAALDRLAHLLWSAAGLPRQDKKGKTVRIYFRAAKLAEIDKVIDDNHSKEILRIAEGPLMEYVISYRNKYTHEAKEYSVIAGAMPSHDWVSSDGKHVTQRGEKWEADLLFALGNATYHQFLEALKPTVSICEAKFS
jgi:hypothetical protein